MCINRGKLCFDKVLIKGQEEKLGSGFLRSEKAYDRVPEEV